MSAQGIRADGTEACSVVTIVVRSSIQTALISPATPAAVSRCPTLLFALPRAMDPVGAPRSAAASAATSTGSPSGVPVPCASIAPRSPGRQPATASASAITAACPSWLGAVNPTLRRPSLFVADPSTSARIRSRPASSARRSTTSPPPEPNTVPAASSAKLRQCPSGESMPPAS